MDQSREQLNKDAFLRMLRAGAVDAALLSRARRTKRGGYDVLLSKMVAPDAMKVLLLLEVCSW